MILFLEKSSGWLITTRCERDLLPQKVIVTLFLKIDYLFINKKLLPQSGKQF
jgi:hypothetical protein